MRAKFKVYQQVGDLCVELWLSPDPVPVEELLSCLVPYPDDAMQMHAVSTLVNKPGIDRPECIRPVN